MRCDVTRHVPSPPQLNLTVTAPDEHTVSRLEARGTGDLVCSLGFDHGISKGRVIFAEHPRSDLRHPVGQRCPDWEARLRVLRWTGGQQGPRAKSTVFEDLRGKVCIERIQSIEDCTLHGGGRDHEAAPQHVGRRQWYFRAADWIMSVELQLHHDRLVVQRNAGAAAGLILWN